MSATNNFIPNFVTNKFHPDDRVNSVIRKGKNGSYGIREMVDNLEALVGCKGAWKTQDVVNEYNRKSITFDQFVVKYLSIPIEKVVTTEDKQNSLAELRSNLWAEQAVAYEDSGKVPYSADTVKVLKKLVHKHLFRDCVFPSEDKMSFQRTNFVILDDKDKEDASQSSSIGDILFTHLNKSDCSIQEKVYWWKTYNGEVYSHFSSLRCQVVRCMFTNFIQLYETEKKHNIPSDSDAVGTPSVLTSSQDSFIETPLNLLIQHCDQNRALLADEVLDPNIEKDAYRAFLDICASAFFPKDKFKAHMRAHALSKVLTETEEAFALLSLENNYERWLWFAEKGTKANNGDIVRGLPDLRYQHNPTQRKDKRTNGGQWTPAGKRRMNDLLEKVATARVDRMDFEKTLKDMYVMGCSSEEVASRWIRSDNSYKKRRRENVTVKNCLSISKRAAV